VHAEYTWVNKGTWPTNWPKELEPLRTQSRTFEGPLAPNQHYAIPFANRKDFESSWPHLLKVKSKESSLHLTRGPNFFLGQGVKAGIVVHSPPVGGADNPANPGAQVVGRKGSLTSTYIELIVDGEIVDLNRIPLPAETMIVDDRFKELKNK
jgi:hypothetical protein